MSVLDLYYRRLGPDGATPVIILHGLFGSSDNLGSIARELAEPTEDGSTAFDVYMVDLRDHGRSPHGSTTSYPLMAADVHALVMRLGLKDIILVGHSMGGKTAMLFAQRWPELLKRLVVIDISPKEHANNQDYIVQALRAADLSPGRTRKEVEAHIAQQVKEPGVVQFLLKSLFWKSEDQLAWRMNVELLDREMEAILAAIGPETVRVPTLFIRGGQSGYITREDLPAIKEQFPNSRVETIAYAGHWVHAQAPDEVVAFIRKEASS
ncbi:MAG: alpha/beta fold hydrolase [Flavobacteriales bacterium]|nr:alpha/beta fold hydrolase [Flavobacteriales bacterium]MCC6938890.1 alpha/beta fold hydrolase [Flavobacteriales bacterium]